MSRRNVYAFSMSVAAHEVFQCIGVVTSNERIGGSAPQVYHCYPWVMECLTLTECQARCGYAALTATVANMSGNMPAPAVNYAVVGRGGWVSGAIKLFLRKGFLIRIVAP